MERCFSRLKQHRALDSHSRRGLRKVTLHALMGLVTMQAAEVVRAELGEIERAREVSRKVAQFVISGPSRWLRSAYELYCGWVSRPNPSYFCDVCGEMGAMGLGPRYRCSECKTQYCEDCYEALSQTAEGLKECASCGTEFRRRRSGYALGGNGGDGSGGGAE